MGLLVPEREQTDKMRLLLLPAFLACYAWSLLLFFLLVVVTLGPTTICGECREQI
jgi:hypothetical protein